MNNITSITTDVIIYMTQYLGPYECCLFLSTCKKFWELKKNEHFSYLNTSKKEFMETYYGKCIWKACTYLDVSLVKRFCELSEDRMIFDDSLMKGLAYANHEEITNIILSFRVFKREAKEYCTDIYYIYRRAMMEGFAEGGHLREFKNVVDNTDLFKYSPSATQMYFGGTNCKHISIIMYALSVIERYQPVFVKSVSILAIARRWAYMGLNENVNYMINYASNELVYPQHTMVDLYDNVVEGYIQQGYFDYANPLIKHCSGATSRKFFPHLCYHRNMESIEISLKAAQEKGVSNKMPVLAIITRNIEAYRMSLKYCKEELESEIVIKESIRDIGFISEIRQITFEELGVEFELHATSTEGDRVFILKSFKQSSKRKREN